jgi:hypothetical protein
MIPVTQFIITLVTSGAFTTLLYFLISEKIKAQIQYSTKITYDRLVEDYKYDQLQRQKAALVAELLAEWTSKPDDLKRLNQLTFEAFVWLPKETALRLSDLLSHEQGASSIRDILAEVRTILLGVDETIPASSIIFFSKPETTANELPTEADKMFEK